MSTQTPLLLSRLRASDILDVIARGGQVIDIRTPEQRARHGVLPGALAIDPAQVVTRLDAASPGRLRTATDDSEWIIVCLEGDASQVYAARIRARGVVAHSVHGGFHALVTARMLSAVADAEHIHSAREAFTAHALLAS